MRSGIFRSTPLRLTLILGTTFFAALIVAGLAATALIQNELARRLDRSITDTFNVIAQAYGDSDLADLMDSIGSHVQATRDYDQIYALMGPDGHVIVGNASLIPLGSGWMTLPGAALGIENGEDAPYRAFVGTVEGNRLLVGRSFAENDDISRLALNSIGWTSIVVLVMVVATGIVLAVRAQRRINSIAQTMALVGHGELTARIPLGSRGDDIDALARQVNTALDRLGNLVEGMRQVSVNIAHDLKTPLNRLAITIESAINAEAEGARISPVLAQAETEIRQINATFDALLRIAQIEAGARRARFVKLQIAAVLDRIREAYVDVADERGQELRVTWPDHLPPIDGDADLLTQLCANLIENSMRHGPVGTRMEVGAECLDDTVLVTFADNGPGIPSDERGKVFERLYRIDKSRTTPGSGLGLSLVKAIADLHGAHITMADNRPGLRLTIAFPIAPPSQVAVEGHRGSG